MSGAIHMRRYVESGVALLEEAKTESQADTPPGLP